MQICRVSFIRFLKLKVYISNAVWKIVWINYLAGLIPWLMLLVGVNRIQVKNFLEMEQMRQTDRL